MSPLILAYDLSFQAKLTTFAQRSPANFSVVINPQNGPISRDAGAWFKLMQAVESARLLNPKRITINWYGYINLENEKDRSAKSVSKLVAEITTYQRDYKVTVNKKELRPVTGIWADNARADAESRIKPVLVAVAPLVHGGFGKLIANPGESIKPNHWLWTCADLVCTFEGNEEHWRNLLPSSAVNPDRTVWIASYSHDYDYEALRVKALKANISLFAATNRLDYQRPSLPL